MWRDFAPDMMHPALRTEFPLRFLAVLVVALSVCGCTDANQVNNPIYNAKLGRLTGVFEGYRGQDILCELIQIGDIKLSLTLFRDDAHPLQSVTFDPLPHFNEPFLQAGFYQYKLSEPHVNPAFSIIEWDQPIPDKRPNRAVPTKYFPVYVHRIRVPPQGKVCDGVDCLEVVESEIADSTFWCEDLRDPT